VVRQIPPMQDILQGFQRDHQSSPQTAVRCGSQAEAVADTAGAAGIAASAQDIGLAFCLCPMAAAARHRPVRTDKERWTGAAGPTRGTPAADTDTGLTAAGDLFPSRGFGLSTFTCERVCRQWRACHKWSLLDINVLF
jgi:hypothetical protein